MKKLLKIKTKDKTEYYNSNGKRHRDNDLPAVIWPSGTKHWYRDGKHYRDNDLPTVIYSNGSRQWWYRNGEFIDETT